MARKIVRLPAHKPLFSVEVCKWLFIAALYELVRENHVRMGAMLSREDFLKKGVWIATTPEAVAEVALGPHPMEFVKSVAPVPQPQSPRNGIILGR